MLSIEFLSSWAFWLFPVVILLWIVARYFPGNLTPNHKFWVTIVRSLSLALLILGMCQPVLKMTNNNPSVAFLVDVSSSVSDGFISEGLNWIDSLQKEDRLSDSKVIYFSDKPISRESYENLKPDLKRNGQPYRDGLSSVLNLNATNIDRAINYAIAQLERDRDRKLVLLSDGNETVGDLWSAVDNIKRENIQVHTMIPKLPDTNDAWIINAVIPDKVRDAETFKITVEVYSPKRATAEIEIRAESELLTSRSVELDKGVNITDFQLKFSDEKVVNLTANLKYPSDPNVINNAINFSVPIENKPNLLFIANSSAGEEKFAEFLNSRGFSVRYQNPEQMGENLADLENYDLVFISNVKRQYFSDLQMVSLEEYVRDLGGGIIFSGGENVFGDNGYSGTQIENILPSEFKAREKKKDLALVIAIDRSYSMKGRKIEYAKEASRAALDLLEEQHKFAVVAFDSQPYISVPMRMVRSKRRAEDRISRIKASGQTNIYPALGVVYRLLQREKSVAKHVILLSDGDTHAADFEKLLGRIRKAGIIVSTVTIGDTGDPALMKRIANWGGGENYTALSAAAIPQIFIEETQKALKSSGGEDIYKTEVNRNIKAFDGVEIEGAPLISGLISTKPKETSETVLQTSEGEPLLARWQFGLGKSVLFSSTVSGRWSKQWQEWDDYGKFWEQVIRDTLRSPDTRSSRLNVLQNGSDIIAKITLIDAKGEFRENLSPSLNVENQTSGKKEQLALYQIGPGAYEVNFKRPADQKFVLTLSSTGGVGDKAASAAGIVVLNPTFSKEFRTLPPNLIGLSQLSAISGGVVSPEVTDVMSVSEDSGVGTYPLMPVLVALALILYLFDIFMRRSKMAWRFFESKRS